MSKPMTAVLHTVALTAILFVIALLARIPAIALGQFYGLHAVFVAPFYAFVASWYLARYRNIVPLAIGAFVLSAVLGMMQPVMAISNALPMVFAIIAYAATSKKPPVLRAQVTAIVYGALCDPATLLAGALFGSLMAGGTSIIFYALFAVLSVGLAILGALLPPKPQE